jgi:urease accessory protein
MPRIIRVISAAQRQGRAVIDTVLLDYNQRTAQTLTVTGERGGRFDIDFARPERLRTDDLLELEDGNLIEVVAAPEPLIEARTTDLAALARLAWQLGDRHVPVQFLPNRLRVQRAAAIEALLVSLGARPRMIEAPFEPEGGAYASSDGHAHDRDHNHAHGHHHGHAHGHHHHDH